MPNANHAIEALLFDWDGTLLDSERLGYIAFTRTFQDLGVPFSREWYEANYSPNWYSLYEALGLPKGQWQRTDELWLGHYGEEPPKLVDGADETIRKLDQRGYRLGIVSSGSQGRVTREIEALGVAVHFEIVICREHTEKKKPHPEGLEKAIQLIQSQPETSCYIGDSPEDIHMGKNANVLTVGVRSSFPGSKRLADARPDIYLESISQLLPFFEEPVPGSRSRAAHL